MRKLNPILKIALHVSLWLILFFLNVLFLKNYDARFNYYVHIATWLVYAFVFYVVYYFLMVFFFNKKLLIFALLSLALITGTYFIRDIIFKKHFEFVVSKDMIERERNPFFRGRREMFPGRPPRFFQERRGMRRGRMIANSYGLLLFYLLGFSTRLIQKWQSDEKKRMELEKEKISTELSFLKQQINPHFLFNSLNSIYSLSISKSDSAPDSILKLSSILRYVLYDSENILVYLKDELGTLEDYIELQQLRLTEKVIVKFDIDGHPDNYKIEPLLLIPIIENAYKYGIDNVNESFIHIHITISEGLLNMKVSNKIVAKPDKNKKESGIGIKNIKRRLDLVHPNNYLFEIEEKNNVFTVRLQISLKS